MTRAAILFAAILAALTPSVARAEAAGAEDPQATLRAILEEAHLRVEQPAQTAEPDADPKALRKQALARNVALRNAFWDKTEALHKQEVADLKDERMDECRQVAQEIARIEGTIKEKERERRKAERGILDGGGVGEGGVPLGEGSGGRRHRRNRATPNDGLDNDKTALKQAEQNKRRLQAEIAAAMKHLDDLEILRKRRVEAAYAHHKRAIDAGENPATDQMVATYKAALDVAVPEEKPQPKPKEGKKQAEPKEKREGGEKAKPRRDREG